MIVNLQSSLFSDDRPSAPSALADYDVIVLNSSAGKDSQAMIDHVHRLAALAGVAGRLVVAHADLGRAEWQGTRELAEEQAAHYGIRFEAVTRTQNDLLDHVAARKMWPSPRQRYCTSDHKRAPIHALLTRLTDEIRAKRRGPGRVIPVRILSCMGLRAEESPARAKRHPFGPDAAASNGRRQVDLWLPLHQWEEADVWAAIRKSGVRHHRAYDLGMPRLSCCFCIFAPKAALALAGRHNPELLDEYCRVESETGHKFRVDLSMADVREAVRAGEGGPVTTWRM